MQGRSAFELPVWPRDERRQDQSGSSRGVNDGAFSLAHANDYTQSFNARGHPQNTVSRAAVRRNIRAHNEVLSTIDVCARVDNQGRDISRAQGSGNSALERRYDPAIVQENESGLWIGVADDLACLVATTFVANLRRRIEVL